MSSGGDILVIGLGNPDRGDDGVGPLVARALSNCSIGARVTTRAADMLALLDDWEGCEIAIMIDAATAVTKVGRIHRIDLNVEGLPSDLALASTHAFGLAAAVELADILHIRRPHLIIYAIESRCFEPGAAMSPEVAAAAKKVTAHIADEVMSFRCLAATAQA